MPVIEAQRASILVPHDHRHINHESASGRVKRARPSGGLRDGRVGDAECAYPPGHVDCVVLLECLEYMRDKADGAVNAETLYGPAGDARQLSGLGAPGAGVAGSMHMISSRHLRQVLD